MLILTYRTRLQLAERAGPNIFVQTRFKNYENAELMMCLSTHCVLRVAGILGRWLKKGVLKKQSLPSPTSD